MNDQEFQNYLHQQIKSLHGSSGLTKIYKGYSSDQKFIVEKDGEKYLLKSFALSELESKQIEFDALIHMKQLDVICSRPLEFGTIDQAGIGYMLLTYMEGAEATDELPNYSSAIQYTIGVEAGKELAKMHKWQAPAEMASWYDRKLAKHKQYVKAYLNGEVRIKHDEKFLSFIEQNLPLMKDRPSVFQHDDFHVGNLIVQDEKLSGVIDFNRLDFGDPVHDFLKLGMFSSEVSIPFATGQIKGYHGEHEPDELFWKLYSLYLAMTIISSIVWILKVKSEELPIMIEKLERVLNDHDYFNQIVPRWYVKEQQR
ncbi:aminoglycoside phosphotransferase family protein [Paenibacillus sp. sgz302251]|uniref:aminoglycoside phosphotransferase family protein n=1 Tax=Paenibacillus sp. sgz302251 TaxID=3414493 RepID=UPI003C7A4EEC